MITTSKGNRAYWSSCAMTPPEHLLRFVQHKLILTHRCACVLQPEGEGMYRWSDGSEYEGTWLAGQKHGVGRYAWPTGAVFKGEWSNGCMHGVGTLEGPDGSSYQVGEGGVGCTAWWRLQFHWTWHADFGREGAEAASFCRP